MSISERRFQGRFLCADLVKVTWLDTEVPSLAGRAGARTVHAVLEDISALGACVQIEQGIPLGSPITLSIGESRFSGQVCYSIFRDYGHFVGIRFADDTSWSAEMVVPDHLTNLEDFVKHADHSYK